MAGHSKSMQPASSLGVPSREPGASAEPAAAVDPRAASLPFEQVYATFFDFVWRSARRLGVAEASLDDVVQDVFVTVHRKLPGFEGRSTLKTWIFGIVLRVARDHRRTLQRKPTQPLTQELVDTREQRSPQDAAERAEGLRLLYALLETLSDDKREVFVLVELEQLAVPEIAELLQENVNTLYARLRAARQDFDAALRQRRAEAP